MTQTDWKSFRVQTLHNHILIVAILKQFTSLLFALETNWKLLNQCTCITLLESPSFARALKGKAIIIPACLHFIFYTSQLCIAPNMATLFRALETNNYLFGRWYSLLSRTEIYLASTLNKPCRPKCENGQSWNYEFLNPVTVVDSKVICTASRQNRK